MKGREVMELTPGQLTIWDMEFKETPKKAMKNTACVTEFINKITICKNDKTVSPLKPTEEQQKFLDKNKVMENDNLSRIIKYFGGGLGIELTAAEGFKTIYVNVQGKEEFTKEKKLPVLPMDKILLYQKDLQPNEIQEEKLKEIKSKHKALKEIRRKGDDNIILELQDKVISINTIGWSLEFNNVQATYLEDEVIEEDIVEDLQSIQKKVKPGDFVQAQHGKELIEGTITHEYGIGNEILNIVFGNKHTAIGRIHVMEIIKSA
ncbi:hypothetical protein [Clostridium botulinum]|uniref:Uncharacterized protein n=2 Tax=Clostridium botulinum TaxID=1491 RepID=A0A3F2ZWZ0_CLOB6|nr:hypothetical protein [Clostridium botulinum]ACQ52997.1 hypothetical protein CLJ_B2554 [Clostridium botulinum Ba4 str. 657]